MLETKFKRKDLNQIVEMLTTDLEKNENLELSGPRGEMGSYLIDR